MPLFDYDQFVGLLEEGHKWQYLPATFFLLHGFVVEVPPLTVCEPGQPEGWEETVDLFVNEQPIEIKAQNYTFMETHEFPEVIVDTVLGYDRKTVKPLAYIILSKPTGAMLWVAGRKGQDRWVKKSLHDPVRHIQKQDAFPKICDNVNLYCSLQHSFDILVLDPHRH